MHISFYISDSQLSDIDRIAKQEKISRSKAISRLIDKAMNRDAAAPTAKIAMESQSLAGEIRVDCRHFRGEMPCVKKKVCWNCDEFAPVGKRALVIKFGAAGDALRTTPILRRLRDEGYSEIVWISDQQSHEVLSLAGNIDRLVVAGAAAMGIVQSERFDTVFSFDKDLHAAALAVIANSRDKRGFSVTPSGRLSVFDKRAAYALRLGIDDDLKFRENLKTVPALTYEIAGYPFAAEEYELKIPTGITRVPRRVALNLGVGPKWPTKAWPEDHWANLAKQLVRARWKPVFVGGPAEAELMARLSRKTKVPMRAPAPVAEFAAFLASCASVVTSDSLALHIALAARAQVIGLFCSTTPREIEWYGRGEAIVAPDGPCYNSRCAKWPGCIGSIKPEAVMKAVERRAGGG